MNRAPKHTVAAGLNLTSGFALSWASIVAAEGTTILFLIFRALSSKAHKPASTMALPPEIIRILCACLVRDETPSNRTLQLMSFCGVCKRWREFGREISEALAFDSTDTQHGPKTTLSTFKKAPTAVKRDLFQGASRLLTGYSDLTLSGEAINDQMLLNIAVANGPALTSTRLQGTPNVTDAGLCTLISAAPNLKLFSVEDAGQGVIGHFVPSLLQHCKQLETLLIEGAESMDWATLRLSGAWAAAMAAAATAAPAPPAQADAAALAPASSNSIGHSRAHAGAAQAQQQARQLQECASAGASSSIMPCMAPAQRLQGACFSMRDSGAGSANNNMGGSSSSRSSGETSSSTHGMQSQASSSQAGPSSSQQQLRQQQRVELAHAPRVSSSSTCSGHSEFSSCQEEGAVSDDGSSSSSNGSIDARSDSTSFSMPAQAVEALAQQLQQMLSTHEHPTAAATAAAAAAAGEDAGDRSSSDARAQHSADTGSSSSSSQQQQQQRRRRRASRPCHAALRRLRVRLANVDTLQQLLECVPGLTELQLDGPALSIQAAAVMCPGLRRLSYLVCSPADVDAALLCLSSMRNLRALELEVKGMVLSTEQLRVIGLLPLRELCLDSHAYRQHPSMPRPQYSHLDNDGVKGLVDSICSRMRTELMPLKLSLCGATALKQEAVSALLRLPILASIDTGGCVKLTPMDRMRLVAKVKAGQGLMDKTAAGGVGGGPAGGLRLPHFLL